MPRYAIHFLTTADAYVVVEADDKDTAIDRAYDEVQLPYFPGGMNGDLGEWEVDEDSVYEVED